MTRRTITVTLTEQQFRTLSSAIGSAESEWLEMAADEEGTGERYFGTQLRTLERAWGKISAAWYDRERPRR